jgi:alpha-galactosidase
MKKNSNFNAVAIISISCFCGLFSFQGIAQKRLKVFILAGQSNMEGHGEIYADGSTRAIGSLAYEVKNDKEGRFKHIVDKKGKWVIRKDVWVRFNREEKGLKKGNLTIGYGSSDKAIGPEFQFGFLLGDFYKNQVLIIKTAWGGKSLGVDFRPPSSGGVTGLYYNKMIEEVATALKNISTEFPGYKGQGYEIAGFFWNQGWNDAGSPILYNEYEKNMVNFIKDVRKDLNAPNLPFVIANCGQGGLKPTSDKWMSNVQHYIVQAQAAASAKEEFTGNVALADTRPFWKDRLESPAEEVHHYNRNAKTFFMMGDAAGRQMMNLLNLSATKKPTILKDNGS